ncbi:MAG: hypothetical protein KDE32_11240 [Novosphingobium sp.]|nr:hypothetical protein [Novosphingobium sp.]
MIEDSAPSGRTVTADVVAINQPLVYNRFGSTNPWGMIYALRRDTTVAEDGQTVLRATRRPRPLVLRVAAGDVLEINFQNLLKPMSTSGGVAEEPEAGDALPEPGDGITVPDPPNDPRTRRAGIAIVGLEAMDGNDPLATGLVGIEPGARQTYRFKTSRPGAYFFSSLAAIAGGEGNGGSLTHGLFGMVIVEPRGAKFYRSQVDELALTCAKGTRSDCTANAGMPGYVNYEALDPVDGNPVLNMLADRGANRAEIVHGDLTAIVVDPLAAAHVGQPATDQARSGSSAWREFAIMFHDELKTVHAADFAILNDPPPGDALAKARNRQLAGIRDGFAINYGASGAGTIVLANRMGKGPAKKCVDCAYEEFFLQSWANGDPALLPQYRDDPSNVYHSYLGDRVKFYNVHAGPKETHVFHLHAHQWLSQSAGSRGNYLDSQTIGPFQAFSYEIYYGGTGNRNLTPGDSIFHCHLYPHFAQGMWGLWRVHETIEDGTRALPDGGGMNGEWEGLGTDPETGLTSGGTPIPGLVPLPGQALPPEPTYLNEAGDDAMPGYPFYIAGKAGYRAPQAPKDIFEDGGLPRHVTELPDGITIAQARTVLPIEQALDQADFTFPIEAVKLAILPQDGTWLEKAAMKFHSRPGGRITRPLSDNLGTSAPDGFLVNGLPAAAGAPFANPCPQEPGQADHWVRNLPSLMTRERTYKVSAIELDLVVNQYGWHDPQARINVLTDRVAEYEGARRSADPFFFRARSGECVVFYHTNRTSGHTEKDAFQVKTPVDTIGQHIHLVKFDVTASDGSANGFNYEDGTLARDHIGEILKAANSAHGKVDWSASGQTPRRLALKTDSNGLPIYQTTTQRWWADPLLDEAKRDRTISTVFTHDHFGPSTIQQHGFYSALLIEPKGSTWKKPDGTPLEDSKGQAVGTQAIIQTPDQPDVAPNLIGNRREFALAVADFALLCTDAFTPSEADPGCPKQFAVAPPNRPESISVDHHDPYMFNYRHEPIPLRIATSEGTGTWRQREGKRGDMAFVFDTATHAANVGGDLSTVDSKRNHVAGDPSTEIFEAYEGDPVQVRLIQGAQEVQHIFTVHGQRWKRQPASDEPTWVSAQEVGISEHFEMDMDRLAFIDNVPTEQGIADYLYHAGSIDALWNGAWGLIRTYADPALTRDPTLPGADNPMRCRLAILGDEGSAATNEGDPKCDGARPASSEAAADALAPSLSGRPDGLVALGSMRPDFTIDARLFCIDAKNDSLTYNSHAGITDPDAARFVLTRQFVGKLTPTGFEPSCPADGVGVPPGFTKVDVPADTDMNMPLVLRVRSGEMAFINTVNNLADMHPTKDNAVLPPVVSWTNGSGRNVAADELTPSGNVSLHAALVSYNVRQGDGARVGLNTAVSAGNTSIAGRDLRATTRFYAGRILYRPGAAGSAGSVRFEPLATEKGLVAPLSSMADPIRHPAMGLIGALVIEPEDAEIVSETAGGTRARICTGKGGGNDRECFEEAVIVYQDGLNLKKDGQSIPDCHVCDDSYDSGDVAFNYRTEPLFARAGISPIEQVDPNPDSGRRQLVDLNNFDLPACLLLPSFKPVETPVIRVDPGDDLVMRLVHPGGRARQRAFVTYGHRYDERGLKGFGSPSGALMAPQKAMTADLGKIAPGRWLYRDGAGQFVAGGAWGYIEAGNAISQTCPVAAP